MTDSAWPNSSFSDDNDNLRFTGSSGFTSPSELSDDNSTHSINSLHSDYQHSGYQQPGYQQPGYQHSGYQHSDSEQSEYQQSDDQQLNDQHSEQFEDNQTDDHSYVDSDISTPVVDSDFEHLARSDFDEDAPDVSDNEETYFRPYVEENPDTDHSDHETDQQLSSLSNVDDSDSDTVEYDINLRLNLPEYNSQSYHSDYSENTQSISETSNNDLANDNIDFAATRSGHIFRNHSPLVESDFDGSDAHYDENTDGSSRGFDSSIVEVDLESGDSDTPADDSINGDNDSSVSYGDLEGQIIQVDLRLRNTLGSTPDSSVGSESPYALSVHSDASANDSDVYAGEYEIMDDDSDVQIITTPDTGVVADSDVQSLSSDSDGDAEVQLTGVEPLAGPQTADVPGEHVASWLYPPVGTPHTTVQPGDQGYPVMSTPGEASARTQMAWHTAQQASCPHSVAHSQPTPYSRGQFIPTRLQRRSLRLGGSQRTETIPVSQGVIPGLAGPSHAGNATRQATSAAPINLMYPSLAQFQIPGASMRHALPRAVESLTHEVGSSSFTQQPQNTSFAQQLGNRSLTQPTNFNPPQVTSLSQPPGGSCNLQPPGGSSDPQPPGGSTDPQSPGGSSISHPPGSSSIDETSQAFDGDEDNEEEQCCPICFDNWTSSGDHRLVSLRCGHLFGQSCIEKWLKAPGGSKCPQCNLKAKPKDIRIIYAKSLKVQDTSEKDDALKQLDRERETRRQAELQAAEARMLLQVAQDECRRLKAEVSRQKQQLQYSAGGAGPSTPGCSTSPKLSQSTTAKYTFDRTFKMSEAGDCRVMAYCSYRSTLCVSQSSSSPLFPGFGVKKVSSIDFRTCQYVSIHTKMIRDIAVGQQQDILLSASMDKTVRLTSLSSNTVVQTYTLPMPVWSCTWNKEDARYFYAGMQNGTVHVYDTRNTAGHVLVLNTEGSKSPAVSMQYLRHNPQASFSSAGLIVGQLDRTSLFEKRPDDYKLHLLPLEANLTSLSLDDGSRHMLATYRPTQRQPSVRHMLYELTSDSMGGHQAADQLCTCSSLHTVHGGSTMKLLARSRLVPHPSGTGGLLVAGDEASRCLHIWDAMNSQLLQKIPIHAPVVDVCNIRDNNMHHLVALTDKQITILKWSS